MDKVYVTGLELTARHGYYDEERQIGNRFRFEVTVTTRDNRAAKTEDLDETVDYSVVSSLIRQAADGPSAKLVETLAERIATSILERFEVAQEVSVRVGKLDPPSTEGAEEAGVQIVRSRS